MRLSYYGHSCFCLETKAGVRIVFDPFTRVGYEMPEIAADIAVVSHRHFDHDALFKLKNCRVTVEEGSYEGRGVSIVSIPSFHDDAAGKIRGTNLIHRVTADGFTVCHLGDLGEEPDDARAELIAGADVLLIPVGGTYTIAAPAAVRLISRLKPKHAVPMHYACRGCALDIAAADDFIKAFDDVSYEKSGEAQVGRLTSFVTVFDRKED